MSRPPGKQQNRNVASVGLDNPETSVESSNPRSHAKRDGDDEAVLDASSFSGCCWILSAEPPLRLTAYCALVLMGALVSRDYMGYGEEEEEQDTDRHRMHYGCRLMGYSRRFGSVCQKSIVLDKLEER